MNKSGKDAINEAKTLIKAHGIDLMGWNAKPGKEFVSLTGDGDKLQQLKPELEKLGWLAWPMSEAQESCFMDFGMYMPPAGYTPYTGPGKPSDEITAVYASADFQYSGVTQNYYLYVIVGLCLIFWRVPTDDFWRYSYQLGQHNNYLLMTIATLTAMLVGAILNWIIIDADKTCMIIRRPILFMRREIALDSIKKAKIYTEKTSRLGKTTFLTVDLKSGKSFDLFLFKQARNDLASFLTNNITP